MHNLYKCMQMLCSLPWKGPEGNSLGIRSPSAAEWAVIIVERNSTQQGRREERAGRGSCPGSARGSSGPSRGSSRSRELFAAVPVPGMNTDQLPASEPRLAGGEKRTCTEPVPHPARAAGAGARLGGPRRSSPVLPVQGPVRPGRRRLRGPLSEESCSFLLDLKAFHNRHADSTGDSLGLAFWGGPPPRDRRTLSCSPLPHGGE